MFSLFTHSDYVYLPGISRSIILLRNSTLLLEETFLFPGVFKIPVGGLLQSLSRSGEIWNTINCDLDCFLLLLQTLERILIVETEGDVFKWCSLCWVLELFKSAWDEYLLNVSFTGSSSGAAEILKYSGTAPATHRDKLAIVGAWNDMLLLVLGSCGFLVGVNDDARKDHRRWNPTLGFCLSASRSLRFWILSLFTCPLSPLTDHWPGPLLRPGVPQAGRLWCLGLISRPHRTHCHQC